MNELTYQKRNHSKVSLLNYSVRWITVICVVLLGSSAAEAANPEMTLKRANKRFRSLLKAKKKSPNGSEFQEKLRDQVNELLDLPHLAQMALGRHWDTLSKAERRKFVNTFSKLMEQNYLNQLDSNLKYRISYRSQQLEDGEAKVVSVVHVNNEGRPREVIVEYRMHKKANGQWAVYDVITDDVSIMLNYRSQFNRIIRKQSYQALVQKMERKLKTI